MTATRKLGPLARLLAEAEARQGAPALERAPRPRRPPAFTARQIEVLAALRAFVELNGFGASVRELAEDLGCAPSTVVGHLYRLEHLGAIELTGRARAIRLLVGVGVGVEAIAKAPRGRPVAAAARPRLRVVEAPPAPPAVEDHALLGVSDFDICNGVDD